MSQQKKTSGNKAGISRPAIRRLAKRSGVQRVSDGVFAKVNNVARMYITDILDRAVVYANQSKRKTVAHQDVLLAAQRVAERADIPPSAPPADSHQPLRQNPPPSDASDDAFIRDILEHSDPDVTWSPEAEAELGKVLDDFLELLDEKASEKASAQQSTTITEDDIQAAIEEILPEDIVQKILAAAGTAPHRG
ncbi:histone-like protein [Nocardia sp. CA-107356]|uniref:histone-like protein n=1 Tax=Nocardia sp. CA-107356 TaxID=3239972 RepID=UPI003D93E3EF